MKKEYLKYVLLDKDTNKAYIYRFKTHLADKIGVNVRTLDRNMPYKTDKWEVYRVENIEI